MSFEVGQRGKPSTKESSSIVFEEADVVRLLTVPSVETIKDGETVKIECVDWSVSIGSHCSYPVVLVPLLPPIRIKATIAVVLYHDSDGLVKAAARNMRLLLSS